MKIEKILIKVSGDLIYNKKVLNEIKDISGDKSKTVHLIYGFGTIFSNALTERKIPFKYVNDIRETTDGGLRIGLNISNDIETYLRRYFNNSISLISPIENRDGKIINTNADEIVMQHYHEYDKVIIYTLKNRIKEKFNKINNLEIRYIIT